MHHDFFDTTYVTISLNNGNYWCCSQHNSTYNAFHITTGTYVFKRSTGFSFRETPFIDHSLETCRRTEQSHHCKVWSTYKIVCKLTSQLQPQAGCIDCVQHKEQDWTDFCAVGIVELYRQYYRSIKARHIDLVFTSLRNELASSLVDGTLEEDDKSQVAEKQDVEQALSSLSSETIVEDPK